MTNSTKTISRAALGTMHEYEFHPFANAFPMMTDQEHAELVADIKANGLEELIRLYDDKILDGRNRYRALLELELDPADYVIENDCLICTDKEALAYVISMNIMRRHLTTSQRAMIAADLSTLRHGQRKSDTSNDVSQADASKLLHVSLPTTPRARKVKENSPELATAVRAGDISVSRAVAQIGAAASNGAVEPAAQVAAIVGRAKRPPVQTGAPDAEKQRENEAKYKNIAQTIIDRFSTDDIQFLVHDVWGECCCGNCLSLVFHFMETGAASKIKGLGTTLRVATPRGRSSLETNNNSDDRDIAAPAQTEENVLFAIARVADNARAIRKILKASALDREAAQRVIVEINLMIRKWRSVLSSLDAIVRPTEIGRG